LPQQQLHLFLLLLLAVEEMAAQQVVLMLEALVVEVVWVIKTIFL
jgi:hypothetical protein